MPVGGNYFSKVKRARELLRERSEELLTKYLTMLDSAAKSGDFETADKGYRWLLEHIEDEGERIVGISVDKPLPIAQNSGPTIQIGVQIGGARRQELPEPTIITVVPDGPSTDNSGG